jgi:hypothetical protein
MVPQNGFLGKYDAGYLLEKFCADYQTDAAVYPTGIRGTARCLDATPLTLASSDGQNTGERMSGTPY